MPRSILPPKSPFRPHFGAFSPHPGSKSALRCGRGDPLFETPETCHPTSTWKIFSLPTLDDARTRGHRHFPAGSCLRLTTEFPMNSRVLTCICAHTRLPPPVQGPSGSRAPARRLAKMERGPIAMSGPVLSVWHRTGRSLRKNPDFSRAGFGVRPI